MVLCMTLFPTSSNGHMHCAQPVVPPAIVVVSEIGVCLCWTNEAILGPLLLFCLGSSADRSWSWNCQGPLFIPAGRNQLEKEVNTESHWAGKRKRDTLLVWSSEHLDPTTSEVKHIWTFSVPVSSISFVFLFCLSLFESRVLILATGSKLINWSLGKRTCLSLPHI